MLLCSFEAQCSHSASPQSARHTGPAPPPPLRRRHGHPLQTYHTRAHPLLPHALHPPCSDDMAAMAAATAAGVLAPIAAASATARVDPRAPPGQSAPPGTGDAHAPVSDTDLWGQGSETMGRESRVGVGGAEGGGGRDVRGGSGNRRCRGEGVGRVCHPLVHGVVGRGCTARHWQATLSRHVCC